MINAFINEEISGQSYRSAQRILWTALNQGQCDPEGLTELAYNILKELSEHQTNADQLYIEGLSELIDAVSPEDFTDFGQMMRVMEERDKFALLLNEKMQNLQKADGQNQVSVTIGEENKMQELKNLSIISSACKVGGKTVGLIGIVGPKHMEYTKMISLVNFIGQMLGSTITNWRTELEEKEG